MIHRSLNFARSKVLNRDRIAFCDQVFELMEEDPIAAASIGQVYKARLRSTGETVAVKVRYACYACVRV